MLQSGLNISANYDPSFSGDDYQEAFQIMASGQSGKVILDWYTVRFILGLREAKYLWHNIFLP